MTNEQWRRHWELSTADKIMDWCPTLKNAVASYGANGIKVEGYVSAMNKVEIGIATNGCINNLLIPGMSANPVAVTDYVLRVAIVINTITYKSDELADMFANYEGDIE